MKRIFLIMLTIFSALQFSACSHTKVVEITSDPSGAHVEFVGAYLGTTPLKKEVARGRNEWSNRIYASQVKASLGGCSEVKTIPKSTDTPDRIFFNLTKCAPVNEIPKDKK